MEFWIALWKIVLILGVAAFAVMSVWVIVQGYRDIRSMLAGIARSRGKKPR